MNEILFRPHRHLLDESMQEVKTVKSLNDIRKILNLKDGEELVLEYYCYDDRIKWETFIVTVDGCAVGFTNGFFNF